jgi:hypothetical protein
MGGPGFTTRGPGLLPLGEAWRAVRESGSALPPGFGPGPWGDPAGRASGAFGRLATSPAGRDMHWLPI